MHPSRALRRSTPAPARGDVEKYVRSFEGLEGRPGLSRATPAPEARRPTASARTRSGRHRLLRWPWSVVATGRSRHTARPNRQGGSRSATGGAIKRIHLVQHHPDGQSIRHDVMQVDDEDVFGVTELEQGDTNQRKARQVERSDRFFRGQRLQSVFAFPPCEGEPVPSP